ncbi:MAG: MFS transporter [Acidobacteria bacterium]|nr:MFS transporter [Acidobacteriota bacterium]
MGPLLALPLLALVQQNYRALFLIAFLPSAVSTALVLLVRERRQEPARAAFPLQTVRVHAAFRRFLIAIALFSIGNSSDAFVILRAQQLGLDTQRIVLLFAASNVTYVLSVYPAGRFSDRMERRKLFAAGLAVFAGVYAGLAAVPSAGWLWLLFPVYGFYMGLTDGVSRAMVVDFVAPQERAGALGLQAALAGACALPASAIAGQLWQRLGPPAPFLYGAVMATASLAYLLLFVRGRR